MGKTIDAETFLSWLNEAEEELKNTMVDELNPDRKDEGILLTTETVRKYVEKMCKIDNADKGHGWIPVTERLPEDGYCFHVSNDFNYCSKCGQLLDLDEWKRKEEPPEAADELKFDD